MKKPELSSLTITELKALAKRKKVAVPTGAKKTDIIMALAKAGTGASRTPAKASAKPAAKKTATKKATTKKSAVSERSTAMGTPKKRVAARKAVTAKPAEQATPLREWQLPPGLEGPHEGQERVSDAKFFTGMPERKPPMPYDTLPHEHGGERMALLARDPYMAFSFWELPQARLEKEKAWFGWDSKLCVRVYDVTGVQFNGTNAAAYSDQEVYERVGSWYFDFGRPTHSFCADLGLLAPNGRFLTLIRSNTVTMPRDGVSDVLDEEWMLVDEEFMKLYGIPGSIRGVHGGITSPEAQEIMRQRRMLEITSPGTFSKQKQRKK